MVEIRDKVLGVIWRNGDIADLRGADLRGADLHGADLHGAYLHGADLTGADLRGAYLTNTVGYHCLGWDKRGYHFRGVLWSDGWRVSAGCRWFTVAEAVEHWSSKGNKDALARVAVLAAQLETTGRASADEDAHRL